MSKPKSKIVNSAKNSRRNQATLPSFLFSILIALVLTLLPLPSNIEPYRPEWLLLFLIFWVVRKPETYGLGVVWILGLVLDVIRGALLGQHALGFIISCYLCQQFHQRAHLFSMPQQCILIPLTLLPHFILSYLVYGILDQAPNGWHYWLPIVSSTLIWPLISILLGGWRGAKFF
tara:strand:+ start:2404 stop:2928 length:525 start_codon:yes stop_codon:yes gene_type:complete